MRALALAAAAGLTFALAGSAVARPWNDPAGRIRFDAPNGWTLQPQTVQGEAAATTTYVIAGTANNECQIFALTNPNTASIAADTVRRQTSDPTRFNETTWTQLLNGFPSVFPNGSARVLSTSVETASFWPIQRAEVQAPERVVHAALQLRPGVDLITLCMTYDGADPTAVYDGVIRSVGHPNDAALQTAAEEGAAARESAAAAAAAQPEAPPEPRRRRGRGLTVEPSNASASPM